MRTKAMCLLAMAVGSAACDGLADDADPGRVFGHLQGRLTGPVADDVQLELAIVWRGAPLDDDGSCRPVATTEPIVQPVTWSTTDGIRFRIELDGPPPGGAVQGERDEGGDGDASDDGGSVGSEGIPAEHAAGVLVAFDDRDGDGQLDLCRDATCTDVVLGASNPAAPFLDYTVLRQDPEGESGWSPVPEATPETPTALLYVADAWRPYGVREIAAGYAVWRTEADVAAGERFLDAFDPVIDIEVPLVESPVLDQLSCDGGCSVSFERGAPDCPDLETTWCSLRPELPPDGVWYHAVDCTLVSGDTTVCFPVWERLTIAGCSRRIDRWNGCPVDYDSVRDPEDQDPDPAAWDWSCLDPS